MSELKEAGGLSTGESFWSPDEEREEKLCEQRVQDHNGGNPQRQLTGGSGNSLTLD